MKRLPLLFIALIFLLSLASCIKTSAFSVEGPVWDVEPEEFIGVLKRLFPTEGIGEALYNDGLRGEDKGSLSWSDGTVSLAGKYNYKSEGATDVFSRLIVKADGLSLGEDRLWLSLEKKGASLRVEVIIRNRSGSLARMEAKGKVKERSDMGLDVTLSKLTLNGESLPPSSDLGYFEDLLEFMNGAWLIGHIVKEMD